MDLVEYGIDGIVDVVGTASEESAEAAGTGAGLNRARYAAEQAVVLRDTVIDADIELVAVERLASGE